MATTRDAAGLAAAKEHYLQVYEDEHARTMRVLRAYPADKAEMRPAPALKTARELAWIFAMERGLGKAVMNDAFAKGMPSGKPPEAPASWDEVLAAVEDTHRDFGAFVRALPDEQLAGTAKFMTGPKQLGDVRKMDFLWFLLHDEIHHRGQFSIYVRMAGGRVPSIYGPTREEPWF